MSEKRNGAQDRRASWPPILQFVWDLLGDRDRFRRASMVIGMLVLAVVAVGYHVTLHAPLWAKFGIPAGSMAIVSGGGALFRHNRAKRRRRPCS